MADNGDIPLTGDAKVDAALIRIRGKFRDLEDALLVQVHLERRAGDRLREQARAMDRHEVWMAHFESKLTDILMRQQGGPEAK